MSYTKFLKDYTISADEVRENFEWIRQGNLLPHGSTELELTDSAYDLGSDIYEWAEVHTENINTTGEINETWNIIADVTLSATASSIEITGLNGDVDYLYWIKGKLVATDTTGSYLVLNNDSATNYGLQRLIAESTFSAYGGYLNGIFTGRILYGTLTSKLTTFECFIYAKSGLERMALLSVLESGGGDYIHGIRSKAYIWNNTSDTLTSLKIYSSAANRFGTNTSIQVWTLR